MLQNTFLKLNLWGELWLLGKVKWSNLVSLRRAGATCKHNDNEGLNRQLIGAYKVKEWGRCGSIRWAKIYCQNQTVNQEWAVKIENDEVVNLLMISSISLELNQVDVFLLWWGLSSTSSIDDSRRLIKWCIEWELSKIIRCEAIEWMQTIKPSLHYLVIIQRPNIPCSFQGLVNKSARASFVQYYLMKQY